MMKPTRQLYAARHSPLPLFAFLVTCHVAVHGTVCSQNAANPDSSRAQSVYIEAYGPAGNNYSINYDTRFRGFRGWGIRGGLGYLPKDYSHVFSAPIQLTYLVGRKRHFLEVGGGFTGYHSRDDDPLWGVVDRPGFAVFGSLSASYRYQPLVRGVTVRGGISVLFGGIQLPMPGPQLSVGYRF